MRQTENISKSDVLFRIQQSDALFQRYIRAEPKQPVELVLELRTINPESPVSRVRCLGEVVQIADPKAPDMLPTVAVTVHEYRLASV